MPELTTRGCVDRDVARVGETAQSPRIMPESSTLLGLRPSSAVSSSQQRTNKLQRHNVRCRCRNLKVGCVILHCKDGGPKIRWMLHKQLSKRLGSQCDGYFA